jgi:hypothetical protein
MYSMTERCVQMADVSGHLKNFANAEDGVKIANLLKAVRLGCGSGEAVLECMY